MSRPSDPKGGEPRNAQKYFPDQVCEQIFLKIDQTLPNNFLFQNVMQRKNFRQNISRPDKKVSKLFSKIIPGNEKLSGKKISGKHFQKYFPAQKKSPSKPNKSRPNPTSIRPPFHKNTLSEPYTRPDKDPPTPCLMHST